MPLQLPAPHRGVRPFLPLAAVLALLVPSTSAAPAAAGGWCASCDAVAEVATALGKPRATPDLLVELTPWGECAPVDAAKVGTGEPATCSLQAALDWVETRGDPSPGDGLVFVGVTATGGVSATANCQDRLPGEYGLEGRAAGGGGAQVVAIAHRLPERLLVAGCGVELAPEGAAAAMTLSTAGGPVDVVGFVARNPDGIAFAVGERRNHVGLAGVAALDSRTGITVEGSGAAVTIARSRVEGAVDDAILLRGAGSVALEEVQVSGSGASGLRAESVEALAVSDCRFAANAAAEASDAATLYLDNPGAVTTIRATRIAGSGGNSITVRSETDEPPAAPARLAIDGLELAAGDPESGNDGLRIEAAGRARLAVEIAGSAFRGQRANGLAALAMDGAELELAVRGSDFTGNNIAANLQAAGESRARFTVAGNLTFGRHPSHVVVVSADDRSTLEAAIVDNADLRGSDSGSVLRVRADGDPQARVEIRGNRISGPAAGAAVTVESRQGAARLAVSILENRIAVDPASSAYGLRVEARDGTTLCADLRGNALTGGGGREGLRVRQRAGSRLVLEGLAAGADPRHALAAANPGTTGLLVEAEGALAAGPCPATTGR